MSQQLLENPDVLNEPVDPNDRFAYGWRYVEQHDADGSLRSVKIPLTLEDILHPQEEDFRVLSDCHCRDCQYLACVFEGYLASIAGAALLADCRIAWDADGKFGHGPDIAVIFNVRLRQDWATFNVFKEGTKPALIVEVTSPKTRSTDLVNKVKEYAEQGVSHYVITDARVRNGVRVINLIDYHFNDITGEYEEMPPGENGRVWLPEVQLWLGVEAGLLACYDEGGKRKGNYAEMEQEAETLRAKIRRLEQQMQTRNGDHSNGV